MSSTTTKPKRRSSVCGGAPSSLPNAVDPKLMELARQIGINRFNALVQSRASRRTTSASTTPTSMATSATTAESSRSKSTKTSAAGKSGSKQKSVGSAALPVVKVPPSKKGKSTSKQIKHDDDNHASVNEDEDEDDRKARKKQRKLEKKEAKRKAALQAEADMEVDQLASPVKDSRKKKGKKEQDRREREEKKRSKKAKKLDKGKGKEIVQDTPSESSSAANDHPSPAPKATAEPKSKSKSSSKRARPSDVDVDVAIPPAKSPRKKRKLANGSSAAVPSPQANSAVSAPARPLVNGIASTSTDSRGLEQLLTQTLTALRASPSYARESGVFGDGIVELFQALVAKVASANKRRNAPSASNNDDDDLTSPDEDEHEHEQPRSKKQDQNLGVTPLNDTEAPIALTSTTSFAAHTATTSTRPVQSSVALTADTAETETEAAIKARAAKAAKKLLKKERREKKQQKEVAAEAPSSPPEEQEDVPAAPIQQDGPATPLSSPNKSERPNKKRPIRKRLGKLEKGALRSMSQSAGSSRQSSLAPTSALPQAREEIVIKVSDSQAEDAERAVIRAAEPATESLASSPDEEAPLSHSTDPAIRFRGERDDVSENDIDQVASTPALARPFNPLRQAPPSTVSAFSSEDDPDEIELSLRTHASPRKDRPLSLDPEEQSGDESEPQTEDHHVEEQHEDEGDVSEIGNEHEEEKVEEKVSEDQERPAQPETEHEDAVMADAQAQDEAPVEEEVHQSSPTTNGAVPSPGQPSPVDPVNIPLPPSPSPPPPVRTIGHDDDSNASSSSDDDDSDSSSSSTASNRAYRKPSRPSIGAAATSAFGSAASMRKNRAKRQSSPLKTSSLAQNLSSAGPEVDNDAEMEDDIDELLSQPVPKSAVQKMLQDAEMEEQQLEEPMSRLTSVSSSEGDTNNAGAVAETSKDEVAEEQRNDGGDAGNNTQSLKDVNSSLKTAIPAPAETANLSEIAAQASSAPGTPLMMNTQGSQLIRPDNHADDLDESQYVPLIKGKPFLEATQQTQRFSGLVEHEYEDESQKSSQTTLNGSSQVKKALDAVALDVPSQATSNGRLTRAASLRARTASPGPSATAPPAIAPLSKSFVSARPPSASQPLPTTSFRVHGRASSMRALSQLDEATPRRSMRRAGPLASQGSAASAKGALSWVRKGDDGENESEDDSSEDEDRKASSTTTKPRQFKVLWN